MGEHLVPLGGDWALRLDFAVRSAEDCWLELDGERYTCELRIAAVDLARRGHAKIEIG
jgi:hypothetical protein